MQEIFFVGLHSRSICIFKHKFQFLHAALTFRISAMNASLSHSLSCLSTAAALIYLEVHEEIFNEITSCSRFFLPTQSKSLFNGDMNTQNSNFGRLNVKHDELKIKKPLFICCVLEWMMMMMTREGGRERES